MFTLELHPAEGGNDSELFAYDLASAVAKYSGMTIKNTGRIVSLVAEHRL